MDDQEFKKLYEKTIRDFENSWRPPIIGSVSIPIPNSSGPYNYQITSINASPNGSSTALRGDFRIGDRVILNPDNGSGPGNVINVGSGTWGFKIGVLHDSGINTWDYESQFVSYKPIKVGDHVSYKRSYRVGVVTKILEHSLYGVSWDDNGMTIEDIKDIMLVKPNSIAQTPPAPPCCDCGAKSVGSNRHSSWCTVSDLTSLN